MRVPISSSLFCDMRIELDNILFESQERREVNHKTITVYRTWQAGRYGKTLLGSTTVLRAVGDGSLAWEASPTEYFIMMEDRA